jgi:MFS family permease
VLWIILLNVPSIFFTNGFQALQGELIPEHRRAFVMSRRSIIYSIGIVIISALAGAWLDSVKFPENYVVLYIFGFITVLGSQYYLNRIVVPDLPERPAQAVQQPRRKVEMSADMKKMLFNSAVYQFGLVMPGQLFNIFYVRTLNTSDGWLGLNSAAGSFGVVVGYIIWERLLRRRSFFWGQRRATLFTWLFPFIVALFPNIYVILFINFFVNLIHPGVDLSSINVLLKLSSPEDRPVYISWFNMVVNLSMFAGPIVGALIARQWDIPTVLMLSAGLRIVGGILYNVNPVEDPALSAKG